MNIIQKNNITKDVQQMFQYFSTFQLQLLDLTLHLFGHFIKGIIKQQ